MEPMETFPILGPSWWRSPRRRHTHAHLGLATIPGLVARLDALAAAGHGYAGIAWSASQLAGTWRS